MQIRHGVIQVLAVMLFCAVSVPALADIGLKNDMAVGASIGFGGATPPMTKTDGGFNLAIEPMIQYFPAENVSVWARLLWERTFASTGGKSLSVDTYPILVGARYYFTTEADPLLKPFLGLGLGMSVIDFSGAVNSRRNARFAMDIQGGFVYEVMPNLAFDCAFDIFLPNISPLRSYIRKVGKKKLDEKVMGRFLIMAGIQYYFPL